MALRSSRLSEIIEYEGPTNFSPQKLHAEKDLFSERAALFYTKTANIPGQWIGDGVLDVELPICPPGWLDRYEIRALNIPRLWVELLQRATHRLRWRPFSPASVTIIRYDNITIRDDLAIIGCKALLDALKVGTTGRSDGRLLHYFGAIVDDDKEHLRGVMLEQQLVSHPAQAKCRVIVTGVPNDPRAGVAGKRRVRKKDAPPSPSF